MNIKTIIVGSLALGLAIGGAFLNMVSQDKQAVYTPRTIYNGGITGNAGYAAYMHMLKADPATGEIDYNLVNQVRYQIAAIAKKNNKAASGLNWVNRGPDNVGGRTRAILVDQTNPNIVYAGSVTGGLFVSTDATASWNPVIGMEGVLGENLAVSCITQTDNGRIFFGTGSTFESGGGTGGSGAIGNGVYEYVSATGAVLPIIVNSTSVPNNNQGSDWSYTNAIASYGNRLYIGSSKGFKWADPDGSGNYPTDFVNATNDPTQWYNPIESIPGVLFETATVQDIDVASDGSILVCFSGTRVYISDQGDALGDFTRINGVGFSGGRLSGAIAPSNPNVMYVLGSSGILTGLRITTDKGATWKLLVPTGSAAMDPFRRSSTETTGQGGYDDAIGVDPSDWGHVIVGGIRLFEGRYTNLANPQGSWLIAATLGAVHADKHAVVFADANTIYIGSDGGVTRSIDAGHSWHERNFGYNVTSFYDVATAANGFFIGGSQDNGDLLNSNGAFGGTANSVVTTYPNDGQISGDGFDVAFSNQGDGILYATSQNGGLWRATASVAGGGFFDAELQDIVSAGGVPFHTVIENWENSYDTTSVDSVKIMFTDSTPTVLAPGDTVYAGDTLFAGRVIPYISLSNGTALEYTVTSNIILNTPGDSLILQDPIQNRFALATNSGVYVTRDAARLNATSIEWQRVTSSGAGVNCLEFSADGNHLFIGRLNSVIRVSGLNLANDSLGLDIRSGSVVTTQVTGTGTSGVVTGIAADPNNVDNIIVTTGGYTTSNHVYRCINATTGLNISSIQGPTSSTATGYLPFMPVYDAVIDYTDNNTVIIGTEWGVWATDNAFSATFPFEVLWSDESGNGMTHTPVHGVVQQHLGSWESTNSGIVYLGTHGRGFYTTDSLQVVSVQENDDIIDGNDNSFATNLSVYPNPLNNVGTLSFDLKENSETTMKIYNLTGSLVKIIKLGNKAQGKNTVQFEASALSVGSYIISLESGTERSIAKFIVTR
ncbi:MAG: hypothetical protein COB15_13445 [Flavobacteriales bacterium]|nr:MAG: hypothetical protein COB15_13445 [Flavobacteriales bacterium]